MRHNNTSKGLTLEERLTAYVRSREHLALLTSKSLAASFGCSASVINRVDGGGGTKMLTPTQLKELRGLLRSRKFMKEVMDANHPEQIAADYDVSRSTVYEWLKSGISKC